MVCHEDDIGCGRDIFEHGLESVDGRGERVVGGGRGVIPMEADYVGLSVVEVCVDDEDASAGVCLVGGGVDSFGVGERYAFGNEKGDAPAFGGVGSFS